MPSIVLSDARVQVDFTEIGNINALLSAGTSVISTASTLEMVYPSIPNPYYDPAKAADSYYGSPTLTEYAVLTGHIADSNGQPDLANSTITGLQLGYQQSGQIYRISGFTLPGATLLAYANANDGAGLIQFVLSQGVDTVSLDGTGSIFTGAATESDVQYAGPASSYTITLAFSFPLASVLAPGWSTADQLTGISQMAFADTAIALSSQYVDISNTAAQHLAVSSLAAGNLLSVPLTSGTLTLHVNPMITALPLNYVEMPDGGGGTRIYEVAGTLTGDVLAATAIGSINAIPFGPGTVAGNAQAALDAINAGVIAGMTLVEDFSSGTPLPSIPQGQTGELRMLTGGVAALSTSYDAALIEYNAATLTGGSANGQVVIADSSGLAFNAGTGTGSVFAAGGNNLISSYYSFGSQHIELAGGNNTVVAFSNGNYISAGPGSNEILLQSGYNNTVESTGSDLIDFDGTIPYGSTTISAAANNPVVFLGVGDVVFNGGSGHATIVSQSIEAFAGNATINVAGGSQVWLGLETDVITSTGADTIVGTSIANAGAATVSATTGSDLIFAGSGPLDVNGGTGTTTILGSPSGSATLHGGAGGILALSFGNTTALGGAGTDTIAAFSGVLDATGGSGGALLLGSPWGNNILTAGSGQATIFGGGDGDVLSAGSTVGDFILAGPGAETISGIGTAGSNYFFGNSGPDLFKAGAGPTSIQLGTGSATIVASQAALGLFAMVDGRASQVTVQGFASNLDYLSLQGYPAGEAAAALAGATASGGNETLTLSDGSHITFTASPGPLLANFL